MQCAGRNERTTSTGSGCLQAEELVRRLGLPATFPAAERCRMGDARGRVGSAIPQMVPEGTRVGDAMGRPVGIRADALKQPARRGRSGALWNPVTTQDVGWAFPEPGKRTESPQRQMSKCQMPHAKCLQDPDLEFLTDLMDPSASFIPG